MPKRLSDAELDAALAAGEPPRSEEYNDDGVWHAEQDRWLSSWQPGRVLPLPKEKQRCTSGRARNNMEVWARALMDRDRSRRCFQVLREGAKVRDAAIEAQTKGHSSRCTGITSQSRKGAAHALLPAASSRL